jgi:hypothetical protein
MTIATYSPGTYPLKLNKRESKVVEAARDGVALEASLSHYVVEAIVATTADTTTDFGNVLVGDLIVAVPAVAGNAQFGAVAVDATSPFAAVIGDLYLVLRAK